MCTQTRNNHLKFKSKKVRRLGGALFYFWFRVDKFPFWEKFYLAKTGVFMFVYGIFVSFVLLDV